MRNEEEKSSFFGDDRSAIEVAKERLKSRQAKIAIVVMVAFIAVSILVHFVK